MKMTPQEKPEGFMGSNPYNKAKEWDGENANGNEFVSADDSMAYVKKQKVAVATMESEPQQEATQDQEQETDPSQEAAAEPWKKVDYKKRYDDLKRHYDRKLNEFKGKEKELRTQLKNNAPKYTPPKSQEELEKFKEENPDIYNVVETVSHLQASKQLTDLQEELKEVRESLQLEEARRAYAELKTLVPDFEQIRQSDAFHQWAESQPQEIQDWVYKNRTNVQLAAQAINLFKASVGMGQKPPAKETQSDNRGSAADAVPLQSRREEPSGSGNDKVWTAQEIQALSLNQYEKMRDEIDRAFAEGRVVN